MAKGKKVRCKDASLYRRDANGNEIYYHSYGKNSEMGWEIDHSKPQSRGGTDHLNNLRPLKTLDNRKKAINISLWKKIILDTINPNCYY